MQRTVGSLKRCMPGNDGYQQGKSKCLLQRLKKWDHIVACSPTMIVRGGARGEQGAAALLLGNVSPPTEKNFKSVVELLTQNCVNAQKDTLCSVI